MWMVALEEGKIPIEKLKMEEAAGPDGINELNMI